MLPLYSITSIIINEQTFLSFSLCKFWWPGSVYQVERILPAVFSLDPPGLCSYRGQAHGMGILINDIKYNNDAKI